MLSPTLNSIPLGPFSLTAIVKVRSKGAVSKYGGKFRLSATAPESDSSYDCVLMRAPLIYS